MFDFGELVRRAIKYFVEGLMVAIAAFVIPQKRLRLDEVALIALTAAATFSILDTYLPSMAGNSPLWCWFWYRRESRGIPCVRF